MIAYHASHEQFAPSALLRYAKLAEAAGFDAIHSSDHFHPWSEAQGNSGYSFSWLGAAMQATTLPFSVVCAPGQRYHPAIVAQAVATLSEMFPGRFSVELGSGEALNQTITGSLWPDKQTRNRRLKECADVIRSLLAGKEVTHTGLVTVKHARIYSLPRQAPAIFCAALSKETAAWSSGWSDGLLTTAGDEVAVREKIAAFRSHPNDRRPVFLQYSFSYAQNIERALEGAYQQWRSNLVGLQQLNNMETVADFEKAAAGISREDIAKNVDIFTDPEALLERVAAFFSWGGNRIILHNIHPDQEAFLADFKKSRPLFSSLDTARQNAVSAIR